VSAAGQLNCSKSSEQFFHFIVLNQATNGGCSAIRAEVAMCDKCVELDGKIEHYQRLSSTITDQRTLDGIKELVERMKAQKTALHPEQTE
jgi:FAD/FMN-containing dehydrogenase